MRLKLVSALILSILFSCSKDRVPETKNLATLLELVGNNQLSGKMGDTLTIQVRLREKESAAPLANQQLNLKKEIDDGILEQDFVQTNQEGKAEIKWTLGNALSNGITIRFDGNDDYNKSTLSISIKPSYAYRIPQEDRDWHTNNLENANLNVEMIEKMVNDIRGNKFVRIHDIAIVRHNELLFEWDFLPELVLNPHGNGWLTRKDGNHYIASATKSIVSLGVGVAINNGFIQSQDDSLYNYFRPIYDSFSSWSDRKARITVGNLLTMQSGFATTDGDGKLTPLIQSSDMIKFTLDLPVSREPGTHWAYSSQHTNVLGDFLRIVSGEPSFDDFLYKYLFQPMNIPRPEYIMHSNSQKPMLGAGLFLKPRDMLKIGQLVLNDGKWNGEELVTKEWLDLSTTAVVDFNDGDYYAYHWWKRDFQKDGVTYNFTMAAGNGGQVIYISKELDLVVAFTGGSYNDDSMHQNQEIMREYIMPALK